jgi:hypothetical protein
VIAHALEPAENGGQNSKAAPVSFSPNVPSSREFPEEGQQRRGLSEQLRRQKLHECVKFPVFSLIIREFDAESSSHQAATSAARSVGEHPTGKTPVAPERKMLANPIHPQTTSC